MLLIKRRDGIVHFPFLYGCYQSMTHSRPEPSCITPLNSFITGHSFEDPLVMVNDGFNSSKHRPSLQVGLKKGFLLDLQSHSDSQRVRVVQDLLKDRRNRVNIFL